ncbi:MAG: hypothetical protein ACD_52C00256G0009 [uncultured bacterium]|uniref:Uncharacterized protein n=1 Tax=Candidatus Woesebacteria bacterium RIFCSPHIGHO2_12_FULL_41_24 TaxID=1802510 RepID=A0A1F8AQR6_9BACT|nr:MAG: hypothetical protein ACD_52C00256G0009 [uncultured bacterium]OGM28673.1 MAG: hypothetical protein A2873_05655 [Candidatus Woesebacteria bacterium RIFCSPHIGHO2_01_FULL_42_80]OGM34459.1 MAG: hypothetical protein A3D84_04585 [Candidatus Woesebacteria bacterium RIFCSPHIGHO2_02_FULL_42_20]OGM54097.1 MAG: hypothetical protein A3E44_02740 [Candidatus Woesebacteria bacterium RIFCSPHIGHO2_12_FULL_41_24]OGM66266.1 MAG: hypothetical protein A2969_01610 [Candidatus Woesebacteria bacterium RIFCSPLOW
MGNDQKSSTTGGLGSAPAVPTAVPGTGPAVTPGPAPVDTSTPSAAPKVVGTPGVVGATDAQAVTEPSMPVDDGVSGSDAAGVPPMPAA